MSASDSIVNVFLIKCDPFTEVAKLCFWSSFKIDGRLRLAWSGVAWLGLAWVAVVWLGWAWLALAGFGLGFFCQMASPYRILQNQVRSLRAAVSWLSKSRTEFLTLQLVTFSKDICFLGAEITTHFAAEV